MLLLLLLYITIDGLLEILLLLISQSWEIENDVDSTFLLCFFRFIKNKPIVTPPMIIILIITYIIIFTVDIKDEFLFCFKFLSLFE